MDGGFERLSRKALYKGSILNLYLDEVRLPDGKVAAREVVDHTGGVVIFARWEGEVLLVRQYRYATGKALLELPAGKLEPGEDPAECAVRELEEETGYRPRTVRKLGEFYPTPGYVNEILYLYAADGLAPSRQRLDSDEFIDVERMPFQDALAACRDGRIVDAKTALTLLLVNQER